MFGVELHTACDFQGICHQSAMLWILKDFFRTVVLTQATTAPGIDGPLLLGVETVSQPPECHFSTQLDNTKCIPCPWSDVPLGRIRCPSTDERLARMRHMYTMEFYSAINKIEMKKGAGKWMELERLREVI